MRLFGLVFAIIVSFTIHHPLVVTAATIGKQSVADSKATPGKLPNIVLVMADDQGWGQTSYNGHPLLKTPNLDAMAESGLRFDRFYAAAPVCSPTRAAVLTGRTNRRTGVESHGYALRRQEKTIAQALGKVGYATGHFGKWHLNGLRGPGVPLLKNDPYRPDQFGFQTWLSVTNFFDVNPVMSRQGVFEEFNGDSSEIIVDEALKFIEANVAAGKPTLSVIWYGSPHNPFKASEKDMVEFQDRGLSIESVTQLGELVAMDRSLGTLRRRLRELGIADNTLVWFSSDNGGLPKLQPDTTGGLRGFKGTVFEGGLRVPAIIEWPDGIKPRVTRYPAVSMDIFPTLAAIVGLDKSTWIEPQDGLDLTPLFEKEIATRAKPIHFHFSGNSALIDNQIKLIERKIRKGQNKTVFELYDLAADPQEANDLINGQPETAERMKKLLKVLKDSVQRSVEGQDFETKKVSEDHRMPMQWTDLPDYQPYFEQWKDRWEYRSRIK